MAVNKLVFTNREDAEAYAASVAKDLEPTRVRVIPGAVVAWEAYTTRYKNILRAVKAIYLQGGVVVVVKRDVIEVDATRNRYKVLPEDRQEQYEYVDSLHGQDCVCNC